MSVKIFNRDVKVNGDVTVTGSVIGDIQATAGSIGTTELADSAVTTAKLANSSVNILKTTTVTSSSKVYSLTRSVYIPSATVKALLDGSTNELLAFGDGEYVYDVVIKTITAAGSAGTVNIGCDNQWEDTTADADGFIAAHDLNTSGDYSRLVLPDDASQTAHAGGLRPSAGASMTITSSGDLSASSWVGYVIVYISPVA